MLRFLKVLFFLILIALLIVGGYFAYVYLKPTKNRDAFTLIPKDAIYVLETTDLSKGWTSLSSSKMWQHLVSNPFFRDVQEYVTSTDQALKNNNLSDVLLEDRQLLISAHMISQDNYDFLIVADLQKVSNTNTIIKQALKLAKDYNIKEKDFDGGTSIELVNINNKDDKIYIALIDNLIAISFNQWIMEASIANRNAGLWQKSKYFQAAKAGISEKKLFNFYFNYELLDNYMKCYMSEENDMMKTVSSVLAFSAFNINLQDEKLSFDGYTNLTDSMGSYIHALSQIKPAKSRSYEVLSDQTAVYVSMCFSSFDAFYKQLEKEFASESGEDYESYSKRLNLVEKLLNISLQQDFFSWIGNEISFVKLRPSVSTRLEDAAMCIHATDIEMAKKGLKHITDQIPLRFDIQNYRNFEINFLNTQKGLIMMMFGKLFEKLEKPYFTYIEDFVVFSNSIAMLQKIIDDYIAGKTLMHKSDFMDFKDQFEASANIQVFLDMPKVYNNMLQFADTTTKVDIANNKDLILSFYRIGFQMTSEDGMFKNRLVANYDEKALLADEEDKLENNATEESVVDEVESMAFKPVIDATQLPDKGLVRINFPNTEKPKFECNILNKMLNGLVRGYYESGNLKSAVNYKDGKVDGIAYFYYDKPDSKSSEAVFVEDLLSGIYREFYDNGARKAQITYEDGKKHGDAEYYYPTGNLKIEAEFKKGLKNGKWKYFGEDGQVLNKERWNKKKQLEN